jgi:hypothetical protein
VLDALEHRFHQRDVLRLSRPAVKPLIVLLVPVHHRQAVSVLRQRDEARGVQPVFEETAFKTSEVLIDAWE